MNKRNIPPHFKKFITEILFSEEEIKNKCAELGQWVNSHYQNSENLILIGLLKGCIPFFSDLVKEINLPIRIEYMRFSSYDNRISTSGDPRLIMDTSLSLQDADVLVVDEIIDSGLTSKKVMALLKIKNPRSLKMMGLINKKDNRKTDFIPDMIGFESPNKFLIGYGLDYNENFRQLPFIGVFDENYLKDKSLNK